MRAVHVGMLAVVVGLGYGQVHVQLIDFWRVAIRFCSPDVGCRFSIFRYVMSEVMANLSNPSSGIIGSIVVAMMNE